MGSQDDRDKASGCQAISKGAFNFPGEQDNHVGGPGTRSRTQQQLQLATHQRELYSDGEALLVPESLDGYDHRRGHGLGQLIGAYGVVL